ncbi:hypothetical protein [Bacillus cereus]|uniref:hypothetical protein n=1 Tax=Bacillus cereus TaxID=1396 RepID=UPI00077AF26C|nr:hypothetical protein [Bacillus cereus]KXY64610.1 hypothetical protein AT275_06875 [Bacillus cereus]
MTALVGYCFQDGAFLVADTRRILKRPKTNEFWADFEVSKIIKLNENIGFATCGTALDEARLRLQVKVKPNDTKEQITKLASNCYEDLLIQEDEANTRLVIFGHEDGKGFIRHLIWDLEQKKFNKSDYYPDSIFADGFIPEETQEIVKVRLKDSYAPMIRGIQLDLWAEFVMDDIKNITEEYKTTEGANPVGFPIDFLIFRVDKSPEYNRRYKKNPRISERVQGIIIADIYTIQR